MIGIIVPSVLIIVLLVSSMLAENKYKNDFIHLNKKMHPFKFLYPSARFIYRWSKSRFKVNLTGCGLSKHWNKIKAIETNCDIDKYAELIWYKNFSYIFVSVLISLLSVIVINISCSDNDFITKLLRQDSGGKNSVYNVDVIGLTEDTQTIRMDISERLLSESDIDNLFIQICEELPGLILNNNESLDSVNSDLYLPEKWEDTGILINWSSSDTELIDSRGKVHAENADRQGEKVLLTAIISYADYFCESQIDICILPGLMNESQYIVNEFLGYLQKIEGNSREDEAFVLPESFKGKDISYKLHKDYKTYYLLPVLILIIGILKVFSERENIDKKWRKRNSQMIIDYSEIVSKLSVLVSAGMTVRSAWERIVKGYETEKLNNRRSFRYAYEEMLVAQRRMDGGIAEIYAYEEFGQNCGIHNYIKLGNLLSQSVRKGYKGLFEVLQKEAMDSFDERKNIARQHGEEAGVKLLLPIMMLFIIVLIILVFPAFMSI